jgi:hypothetical protein
MAFSDHDTSLRRRDAATLNAASITGAVAAIISDDRAPSLRIWTNCIRSKPDVKRITLSELFDGARATLLSDASASRPRDLLPELILNERSDHPL